MNALCGESLLNAPRPVAFGVGSAVQSPPSKAATQKLISFFTKTSSKEKLREGRQAPDITQKKEDKLRKYHQQHLLLVFETLASDPQLAKGFVNLLGSIPSLGSALVSWVRENHPVPGLHIQHLQDQLLLSCKSYQGLHFALQTCPLPEPDYVNSWRLILNELVRLVFKLTPLPNSHKGYKLDLRAVVSLFLYHLLETGIERLPSTMVFKLFSDGRIFPRATQDLKRRAPSVTATVSPVGSGFASQVVSNVLPYNQTLDDFKNR